MPIWSVVGRGLAYSLFMQPTAASMEGLPLVFRPLSDQTPSNSLVAATPVGVKCSVMVLEALAAMHSQWA